MESQFSHLACQRGNTPFCPNVSYATAYCIKNNAERSLGTDDVAQIRAKSVGSFMFLLSLSITAQRSYCDDLPRTHFKHCTIQQAPTYTYDDSEIATMSVMSMGVGRRFPGGLLGDFWSFPGGQKWWNLFFSRSKLRKQPFLLIISNAPPPDAHGHIHYRRAPLAGYQTY